MLVDFKKFDLHSNWLVQSGRGPILSTAVHAGRHIRAELLPYLNENIALARREEDPLTDILASIGDNVFSCYNSRFEVDLNRGPEEALATSRDSTWGIPIWRETPPQEMIERSKTQHLEFYRLMKTWIEALIDRYGTVLLLDIHSYNHRREGADALPSPQADNPDIDLGMTTLDKARFGHIAKALMHGLSTRKCGDRELDVRENVRYPDGGYWPEWVWKNYKANVCTITLEYKKVYMDEWTNRADLDAVEALRRGLAETLEDIRNEFFDAAYADERVQA